MAFVIDSKNFFSAQDDRAGATLTIQSTADINAHWVVLTIQSDSTKIFVKLDSNQSLPELTITLSGLNDLLFKIGLTDEKETKILQVMLSMGY